MGIFLAEHYAGKALDWAVARTKQDELVDAEKAIEDQMRGATPAQRARLQAELEIVQSQRSILRELLQERPTRAELDALKARYDSDLVALDRLSREQERQQRQIGALQRENEQLRQEIGELRRDLNDLWVHVVTPQPDGDGLAGGADVRPPRLRIVLSVAPVAGASRLGRWKEMVESVLRAELLRIRRFSLAAENESPDFLVETEVLDYSRGESNVSFYGVTRLSVLQTVSLSLRLVERHSERAVYERVLNGDRRAAYPQGYDSTPQDPGVVRELLSELIAEAVGEMDNAVR